MSAILATRGEVLRTYLAKLDEAGVRAVVLHSYEDLPGAQGNDIDLCVDDLQRALDLQSGLASGWEVVRRLKHEITASYSVLAALPEPKQTLKLDLCSDYMALGRRLISADELLAGATRRDDGVAVPAPAMEFGYLLAKAFVKAKPGAAVMPRLQQLHAADASGCDAMVGRFSALRQFSDLERAIENDGDFFAKSRSEFYRAQPRRLPDRPREWLRCLGRALRPTGAMVVVLGPDGAGKSTVIRALEEGLQPFFRRYRYIHFRPGFRAAAASLSNSSPVTEPHGQAPRSLPSSWAKVGYYALDYLSSYWLHLRKMLASSTLIIFDRYYQDLLVDPRRFRLRGSRWLVKLLSPIIPKPMLYLVLDADPEAIHARKGELAVEEIARQREIFREFARRERRAVLLPTGGDEEDTIAEALRMVVARLRKKQ